MERIVDHLCHRVLGYNDELGEKQVAGLKPERLQGLLAVLQYFVERRGIERDMFEGRLEKLLDAVRKW